MKKISVVDRTLLLVTGLLAATMIVTGVENLDLLPTTCYTIGFGVLLVACLLIIIMGFEILDSPLVIIVSSVVPTFLSAGLVGEHFPSRVGIYLAFVILGLLAIIFTRYATTNKAAVIVLAVVHGISGMIIFLLPIILSARGETGPGYALVGIGGGLIGIGGLLLAFLKTGRPIVSRNTILAVLPVLLVLMMAAFTAGFRLR
jgi:hypothetical protein